MSVDWDEINSKLPFARTKVSLSFHHVSRLLLTSDMMSEVRSSDQRVPKMKLLAALELTRGGENEFWLDKMYMARVLCKKNGSNCSFLAGMVVQTFYIRL